MRLRWWLTLKTWPSMLESVSVAHTCCQKTLVTSAWLTGPQQLPHRVASRACRMPIDEVNGV